MENGNSEITFSKIKRLLTQDPFVAFTLHCGDRDIEVTHPNAIAFHPEVPYLTIYDKSEIYDLAVDNISFVQRQHVH